MITTSLVRKKNSVTLCCDVYTYYREVVEVHGERLLSSQSTVHTTTRDHDVLTNRGGWIKMELQIIYFFISPHHQTRGRNT